MVFADDARYLNRLDGRYMHNGYSIKKINKKQNAGWCWLVLAGAGWFVLSSTNIVWSDEDNL